MSWIRSFTGSLPPLHREGYRFVVPLGVATLIFFLLWPPLGELVLLILIFVYFFFRDSPRFPPDEPPDYDLVVAPADGIISGVHRRPLPEDVRSQEDEQERICISVFMSVFNCHVNRAPVSGVVESIGYHPGTFINAALDKASEKNERNSVVIKTTHGMKVCVVQIAGLVARRIICYPSVNTFLSLGEAFGFIRFGSRVDVYLQDDAHVLVKTGQRAVGGETRLAYVYSGEKEPTALTKGDV